MCERKSMQHQLWTSEMACRPLLDMKFPNMRTLCFDVYIDTEIGT